MKVIIVTTITIIAFTMGFPAQSVTKPPTVLSSVCNLPLSDHTKQANISFTDIYTFKVGNSNQPAAIKASRTRFTEITDVTKCLDDWRLVGFPRGTIFHIEFSWKHPTGWNSMRISSKDYAQITLIESR